MSPFNQAKLALKALDTDSFVNAVAHLNKEQIQELASQFKVISVKVFMSGSWVEQTSGNLIDSDGRVVQKNVSVDKSYRGYFEMIYGQDSLHLASLIPVNTSNYEYDEDYFTPGEMLFAEDYGYSPDSFEVDIDCIAEFKNIREDEIDLDDFDEYDLSVEDSGSKTWLNCVEITANRIELTFKDQGVISLPLQNTHYSVLRFAFSVLFMSSNKSIAELRRNEDIIKSFMECHYEIVID